jgi:Leucine-rich repeat (LRR) protein
MDPGCGMAGLSYGNSNNRLPVEAAGPAIVLQLNLRGPNTTDADCTNLNQYSDTLKKLDLSDTRVTTIGLAHLAELKKLEILDLSGARISDNGLPHLKAMKSLKYLVLLKAQMSRQAITALKESNPELEIILRDN